MKVKKAILNPIPNQKLELSYKAEKKKRKERKQKEALTIFVIIHPSNKASSPKSKV